VEKSELQALLGRYERMMRQPLAELQAACMAQGVPPSESPEEMAKSLLNPVATKAVEPKVSSPQAQGSVAAGVQRVASEEVQRIMVLRKESFYSIAAWGFAVLSLGAAERDVSTVQSRYRAMMKKLHPDKVGHSAQAVRAVELLREAKEACEKNLCRREPPGAPRRLTYTPLCTIPGKRRFRLSWDPPVEREGAPVYRYIVAALDPAYGRALTVTVLEPDYNQELRRYVSVDELRSYVLAEEELEKMPKLFQQASAQVQVTAANDTGQSQPATCQVAMMSVQRPCKNYDGPDVSRHQESEDRLFDLQVRRKRGIELRSFLSQQKVGVLKQWLKSVLWPPTGNKEELIDRVIFVLDGARKVQQ